MVPRMTSGGEVRMSRDMSPVMRLVVVYRKATRGTGQINKNCMILSSLLGNLKNTFNQPAAGTVAKTRNQRGVFLIAN